MKKIIVGFIIGIFTVLILLIQTIIGNRISLEKLKKLWHILKGQNNERFK